MTTTENKTATQLYPIVMRASAAHRATGHRNAKTRAMGYPIPLGGHVTAMTAHDAFVDSVLRQNDGSWPEGIVDTDTVRCAFKHASNMTAIADLSPSYAVSGDQKGKGHRATAQELLDLQEPAIIDHALTHAEVEEEANATYASMPEEQRETIRILSAARDDDGATIRSLCPDTLNQSTWRTRVETAREAYREAMEERKDGKAIGAVLDRIQVRVSPTSKGKLGSAKYPARRQGTAL